MGNLRQSMTEEEWNTMGLSMGLVPNNPYLWFLYFDF